MLFNLSITVFILYLIYELIKTKKEVIIKRRRVVYRDFEGDIIPEHVYNTLDFEKCCIAGSYALREFEKKGWKLNDIDIFVDCKNYMSEYPFSIFKTHVSEFIKINGSKVKIVKDFRTLEELLKDYDKKEKMDILDVGEHFSDYIVGTITVKHEDIELPIQFIGIFNKNDTFTQTLEKMCDSPSCVQYKVLCTTKKLERVFIIPNKYNEDGIYKVGDICKVRKEKYESRGYVFK